MQNPERRSFSSNRQLNVSLKVFFKEAFRITLREPTRACHFFRTIGWQAKSARRRRQWIQKGIQVPPILIFSITNQCNLKCRGCYAQVFEQLKPVDLQSPELSDDDLRRIIREAHTLGISFFVLAGGEPFLRPMILDLIAEFPHILFLIFTNGLLIDESLTKQISKLKNLIPLISLEGNARDTDTRRGKGVHARLLNMMETLHQKNLFFGTSLTLTRSNYSHIMNDNYIQSLIQTGNRFFLFLQYTSVQTSTEDLTLTDKQESTVPGQMASFRKRFPALFYAVPWDEMDAGGCFSAGRGFVHINAIGDVEPCPFAPFTHLNIRKISLKEALASEYLEELRRRPELSRFTGKGCALWNNREMVLALLEKYKHKTT